MVKNRRQVCGITAPPFTASPPIIHRINPDYTREVSSLDEQRRGGCSQEGIFFKALSFVFLPFVAWSFTHYVMRRCVCFGEVCVKMVP